jgi:hypothetical protein
MPPLQPLLGSFAFRAATFFAVLGFVLVLAFLFLGGSPPPPQCAAFPPASAISAPQTIVAGLDINSVYNRSYAISAKNALATNFENAVQAGQGEKTLYVSVIPHDAYNRAATVMVLRIPATAPLPQKPVQPVYSDDPYKASQQRTAYENLMGCWTAATTLVNSHLQQIKQTAHHEADTLRSYQLPASDPGEEDIDGFLVRAASWLQTPGAHTLLIASGFRDNQEVNEYDGDIPSFHLPSNTVMQAIWYDCGGKDSCLQYTPLWQSVFSHAGVSDNNIHFSDPTQSQTMTNFF